MNVVVITGDKYPCGDAGAIRQHAIAKLLKTLGHDVLVFGYGNSTNKKIKEYEGVRYLSYRPETKNTIVRILGRYFFVNRIWRYIKKYCDRIDRVLVEDIIPKDYKIVKKIAKRYNAKLIHDSVEWYSPEEFANGEKSIAYRNKEYTNTVAIDKDWRVIAISSYLEKHFSKRCDKVVRIPVIMDIESIECNLNPSESDKVRFSYVGAPGRKDYIKEIIDGFALLSDEQIKKIEFNIVGVNLQQLQSVCGVSASSLERLGAAVVAHGRLPHNEAIRFVREADYTVLFRDASLRYAKAGFPTKIVESLACGTPPVCNLSSDLGLYLKDRENAIIADGHSPEEIKLAVEAALNSSTNERIKMRTEARKTAETHFDYNGYLSEVEKLIY